MFEKIKELVNKNTGIAVGTTVGLGLGVGSSIANVAIGCTQLAFYPLYMANCAVQPVVRIISPIWTVPVMAAIGGVGGAFFQAGERILEAEGGDKAKQEHILAEVQNLENENFNLEHRVKHVEETMGRVVGLGKQTHEALVTLRNELKDFRDQLQ